VGKEDDELDEGGRAVRAEPLLQGGRSVGGERGGPQDGSKDTRGGRGTEGAAEEGAPESLEVEDEAEVCASAIGRAESWAKLVEEEEEDERRGGSRCLPRDRGREEGDITKGGAAESVSGSE